MQYYVVYKFRLNTEEIQTACLYAWKGYCSTLALYFLNCYMRRKNDHMRVILYSQVFIFDLNDKRHCW